MNHTPTSKIVKVFIFLIYLLSNALIINAQDSWVKVKENNLSQGIRKTHTVVSNKYAVFQNTAIQEFKIKAAKASKRSFSINQEGIVIQLPDPNGKVQDFEILKESILPSSLEEKYPEIQSYIGFAKSNAKIRLRMEFGLNGIKAMVYGENGDTYIIEPYTTNSTTTYQVYFTKDYLIQKKVLHVLLKAMLLLLIFNQQ